MAVRRATFSSRKYNTKNALVCGTTVMRMLPLAVCGPQRPRFWLQRQPTVCGTNFRARLPSHLHGRQLGDGSSRCRGQAPEATSPCQVGRWVASGRGRTLASEEVFPVREVGNGLAVDLESHLCPPPHRRTAGNAHTATPTTLVS